MVDPDGDPGPPIDVEGQKVLVVYLFRALGDAVLLAPAVKALFDAGAKNVDVLVQAGPARILKLVDLPWRVHVLDAELDLPADDPGYEEYAELVEALEAKLAKRKYDVAIELTARADVDGRRWVLASNAEHRLGWIGDHENAEGAGLTFGTPDVRAQTDRHWSRYQTLPMRCLGVERPAYDIEFDIRETDRERAESFFGEAPRVVIVPGSRQAERRWSPEAFVRIGRSVTDRGGSVVVCGAPDESKLVRQIAKQIDGARPFTQKNLRTLLAIIESADAVVTNDTGPMHFSFFLGRPTLAIFTWMSPLVWGPWERDSRFITMNAHKNSQAKDEEGILARAAIHYLDGLVR